MEPPAARCGGADDLISGLPDELLHLILIRLPFIAAAARTSILSRRWRRVWTSMPELVLCGSPAPPATTLANLDPIDAVLRSSSALLESVDAVVDAYSAPSLRILKIDASKIDECIVPAHRVARWLGFASQRLAGRLHIHLPRLGDERLYWDERGRRFCLRAMEELALPVCERATEIELNFNLNFFLRLPPTGSFTALTDLIIVGTQMDGGELGRAVSSAHCPCLRKLGLYVIELVATSDVSICSESLEYLYYCALETGKLEVTTPMLLEICGADATEAYIVAPKLEKVEWKGNYDPGRHNFAVAPCHLQSLLVKYSTYLTSSAGLMQRFRVVNELMVSLAPFEGIEGYVNFLTDMDKLPVCETLIIHLFKTHAIAPIMLHLLRRCRCIRKLKLLYNWSTPSKTTSCSTLGCPCLLQESYGMDGCTFDALEEIAISFFTGSTEEEEFVKLLLSRCNMVTLKRVEFTVPCVPVSSEIMEVVEGIRGLCCPNTNVQFNVLAREMPKPSAY